MLFAGTYTADFYPVDQPKPTPIWKDGKPTGETNPEKLRCFAMLTDGTAVSLSGLTPEKAKIVSAAIGTGIPLTFSGVSVGVVPPGKVYLMMGSALQVITEIMEEAELK
jgi:hypothetical protein